ncbi:hypothetical protein [Cytobacillus firmus]|uniref:hypothetical protein n=1 Tax=Cytobacillus firmus TaxID=1399 RepID=UPI00064EC6CF|nr:hypothetical protein [Cytobacillus firmus]KML40616.1 hypothetical protein VL14_13210 [Cytobacillus firmus]
MFYFILLFLTVFPFIFLNVTNKDGSNYSRIKQMTLYVWLIAYLFFIIFSSVYFSSLSIVLLLASPLVLQFIFKQFKDSYLLQELNITFNNFKENFFLRGILIGLITLLCYVLFDNFGYLNYGIFLTFIILIILFFNIQNSLNKNFGLYFILATFWSFISSAGAVQTNLLLVLISLFIPLIPLSLYKPFAQNTYLHIFSFLIYLCIYELLKNIDINVISNFLMEFTITFAIILLGISLLFSFERKLLKLKNNFVPLLCLIMITLSKHYIEITDQLILDALDNLIITLSIITLLRTYGVVLANTYNYTINKESESRYKSSKILFINWMGEALGEDIWNQLFGTPSINKFSKYNQITFIIILALLWVIIKIHFESFKMSFNIQYFPWEIVYILLSLQLINAVLTIKTWFVVHGFIDEKASNQVTSKIFVSILSILICIVIQYWEVFGIFKTWILITFGILYFSSLILCCFNLSVDLINFRKKEKFNNFTTTLAPLMMLLSITITFLAFHFSIDTINIIFIFLSIICLGLGLVSGKFSKSIFAISNIVVKKLDIFIILIIMLAIIIYSKEMIFVFLYYIGYYTTTSEK